MLIDEKELTDKLGTMLERLTVFQDEDCIKGEVLIFIGVERKGGRKGIRCFRGTRSNADFKGRVCEAAMEILINDEEVKQLWDRQDQAHESESIDIELIEDECCARISL